MEGGTTFQFVTDGVEAALERARASAGDRDISVAGGPSTVNQFLTAGLLDVLRLHVTPCVIGAGERVLEGVPPQRLELVRSARGDWIDEEHDPEGFALTFEWQQAEGSRAEHRTELAELDAAEARVVSGSYGVCAVCGRPIPWGQLERRPARTVCVACTDR